MPGRIGAHLRSNLVAYVALFFAVGTGAAYAVEARSIGPKHIKQNAVTGKHLKPGAIKGKHIKNRKVTGKDVKRNTLTAANIDTATLNVPAAVVGVVNPDGSTQELTRGLSVSREESGKYLITIPYSVMDDSSAPVPVFTTISDHHVDSQTIHGTQSGWQISVHFSGGDQLFEFIAIAS